MDRLETKMNWGTPIPLYALPDSVHPRKTLFSSQARHLGRKQILLKCIWPLSSFLQPGFPISDLGGVRGVLLHHLKSHSTA